MKSFGAQLSEARKLKGITQERLAEMLGITRQGISNWERERSLPDLDAIKQLSRILQYEFTITDGLLPDTSHTDAAVENTKPAAAKKIIPLKHILSFIAGALTMLLILQVAIPVINKATARSGYTKKTNTTSMTGPDTISWFTRKSTPASGKPYVVISFSENPVYAEKDSDFPNGAGWIYTVYFTEYNNHAFYPETYTEYMFLDEGHSVTIEHPADDLERWWNGKPSIQPRGQQCITGSKPLQDIIGIGVKLTGKDANGEEMIFYGYMECMQIIKNQK